MEEMTKNIRYIINYTEGQLSERKMRKFEMDLRINKELEQDYVVYSQINEFLRAKSDLDEVRNDPALLEIDSVVKETISEYQRNPDKIKNTQKFIQDSLNERILDLNLKEEVNQIKRDIHESENRLEARIKELEILLRKDVEILRAETKRDLAETKAELIRWVVGVGILQLTIITALLLKFVNQI